MKVTAIIPDELVSEVKSLTQAKNTTEGLITALQEWVSIQHIKRLNNEVLSEPLSFKDDYSAENVRKVNRS